MITTGLESNTVSHLTKQKYLENQATRKEFEVKNVKKSDKIVFGFLLSMLK